MPDAPRLFLGGQKLSRLNEDVPPQDRKRHVCGLAIDEKAWQTIPRDEVREQIHAPAPPLRVGLVCAAGEGKSTNMEWLRFELARRGSRQLPLLLRLDDSDDLKRLKKEWQPGRASDALVKRLAKRVEHAAGGDPRRHLAAIRRWQAAGRITLLIDGLDHAPANKALGRNLQEMLDSRQWRRCPVWISGRPTAFGAHWKSLFSQPAWQFRRVQPLKEPEIRFYMRRNAGGDWYDEFGGESRTLLAIPRLLHLVCGIIRQAISGAASDEDQRARVRRLDLRTPAAVYTRAFFHLGDEDDPDGQGLLAQGLRGDAERIGLASGFDPHPDNRETRVQRAAALLGAIAFEMLDVDRHQETPKPHFASVKVNPFLEKVAVRMQAAKQGTAAEFDRDYRLLTNMNIHALEYLVLDQANDRRLAFRDRTTQAFFAACWASRCATKTELATTRRWLVDDLFDRNVEFREFWRFAAELPNGALLEKDDAVDERRWQTLFRPLYDGSVVDKEGRPIRSTEFLYRSWPRMERSEKGRRIIDIYRAGFQSILAGEWGETPKRIAVEMLGGLILLPGGRFQMGSPEEEKVRRGDERQHWVILSPFRIYKFCVTNEEYELFDPRHKNHRWDKNSHPLVKKEGAAADDLCPVVNVSWYDAWTFAKWTGVRLPSEAEWEYSCRGGAVSYQVFHYGNSLSSHQANFDGRYPYGDASPGPDLDWTMPVKSYEPNRFGLYNMHGNVWEWCQDWYEEEFYPEEAADEQCDPRNDEPASARVLRGGSWFHYGRYCRSAHRNRSEPDERPPTTASGWPQFLHRWSPVQQARKRSEGSEAGRRGVGATGGSGNGAESAE